MDFSFSDEQLKFRRTVIDFARRELNPTAESGAEAPLFPRDLWQKCADFGILGLPLPEAYGGGDADGLTTTLAMEAMGYGCRDQGFLFSIHAHMWAVEMPILRFGTEAQKARYLPLLGDGRWVAAHGMSDVACVGCIDAITFNAAKRGMSAVSTTWQCSIRKRASGDGTSSSAF